MNLTDHLNACAELWTKASGKSVSRLSTIVVNDGKFFPRLGQGRLGITTATLEKFAEFFADAGSWPEGRIPAEVGEFIHRVAGISPDTSASSDHANGEIGGESLRPTGWPEGPSATPHLEGGYPLGVGVPGVTLIKIDGVSLPVICAECDMRIDDPRVLQCQHAVCPRRIAA